jgi:tripartite-type tricarboxylate transporter receptor subunit TctC
MEKRMRSLLIASVLVVAWTGICCAEPQAYPSRPVTMVVPLPPGSAFDVTARLLAERLQEQLGQRVIVDNQTGASGSIGTGRCAHAVPDGYTICFGGVGTHVLNAAILALPYDVLKDFEPVSLIATAQLLIVARQAMAANDLKELIAWLKANPGKASQGTGGPGSLTHVAGISLQAATGTRFGSVPYRGAGAAINDLVAGHIDRARDSDGGRGRIAGLLHVCLAGPLGAEGDARDRHRPAQCGDCRGLGRSGGARAARRPGPGNFPAAAADARGPGRVAES